ncbi:hypothetical protein SDC9_132024 [bioreactor metagenome]|uniref:Uncharacterized protein n=1 Tax=bioreactor metagenome TaxID=1076179 RepID=A0A645D7B6_9ZZZZ
MHLTVIHAKVQSFALALQDLYIQGLIVLGVVTQGDLSFIRDGAYPGQHRLRAKGLLHIAHGDAGKS